MIIYVNKLLKLFLKNKEAKNAGWIISGRLLQMALSFFVGLWSARYLGPTNSGILGYVSSYTAFFTSLCTLGITSTVLINEFTKNPKEEGTTLGTAIVLRLISSIISSIFIVAIISIIEKGNSEIIKISICCCIGLCFNVFDIIEYWFQKRYLSKYSTIAAFIGYCFTSIYKIYLLITQKDIAYFAFATSIDYIAIAIVLFWAYYKNKGPKLSFSLSRGKQILSISYHFILSGLMVAVYGQTDKLMLKYMLSETEVGYYTTALNLSTYWVFLLSAIITSLSPTIIKYKKEGNENAYMKKNKQLYCIIFYLSFFVSLIFTVFAPIIISILYGEAYNGSISPLRVITWYVAFSYLGVARDTWLVCENKQKYSKYIYIIAAISNILLNFVFIPLLGATGAALASLLTQIMTSMIIPLLLKDIRPNVALMIKGILFIR